MYDTLVLDGGADKTVSYIGVLTAFERELRSVRTVVATSAGLFIALLFCLRCSPEEMRGFVRDALRDVIPPDVHIALLDRVWETLGVASGQRLVGDIVRRLLYWKLGRVNCTLAEFVKATGVHLRVVVSNITDVKMEVIDVNGVPGVDMVTLACMTTCIPVLFTPVEYAGKMYVDGAVYGDTPSLEDLEDAGLVAGRVLVVHLTCEPPTLPEDANMLQYIAHLFAGLLHCKHAYATRHLPQPGVTSVCVTFEADAGVAHRVIHDAAQAFTFLSLSCDRIDALIERGYACASATLDATRAEAPTPSER